MPNNAPAVDEAVGKFQIPDLEGPNGFLPPGRHKTTFQELEQRFVTEAPFADERGPIYFALRAWTHQIGSLVPSPRLWIDGGFVTHKTWAAPKDVDVVLAIRQEDTVDFTEEQWDKFETLFTQNQAGQPRVQPMNGLVDAFWYSRADPEDNAYWYRLWSRALGPDRVPIPNTSKGFLEVQV